MAIPVLTGALVTLEPLALEHAEDLAEAVQDGVLRTRRPTESE